VRLRRRITVNRRQSWHTVWPRLICNSDIDMLGSNRIINGGTSLERPGLSARRSVSPLPVSCRRGSVAVRRRAAHQLITIGCALINVDNVAALKLIG